jgi:hypothetical protein
LSVNKYYLVKAKNVAKVLQLEEEIKEMTAPE